MESKPSKNGDGDPLLPWTLDSENNQICSDDGVLLNHFVSPTNSRESCGCQKNAIMRCSLLINLTLFLIIFYISFSREPPQARQSQDPQQKIDRLIKETSFYSPLIDKIKFELSPKKMDGTHYTQHNSSIFRGNPSPEVDAAWDQVSAKHSDLILINRTELSKLSKDPDAVVKAPTDWSSTEAYPVQVDVFHQIHCLNELRKGLQFNYVYYYWLTWGDKPPQSHIAHKKHCLHILLQNLMCQASVDLNTYQWGTNENWTPLIKPLEDFSIYHQCRDFDSLLEWMSENHLEGGETRFNDIVMPAGVDPMEVEWPEGP